MPRRILVIANPISGGGRARQLAPELQAHLRRLDIEAEAYFTQCAGDATARAKVAGGEPWDALIAVGGDGTVNEVLNGMPEPSRPLGVLPLGTANVLALELRLPRAPAQLAQLIAEGRTRRLAIGLAGARRFLLFCGAGVDGAVVRRLAAVRKGTLTKWKWAGPILHTVRNWPRFALRATLADGEVLDGLSSVLVTRVRNYGGVLHLTPDIDVNDGALHVLGFRQRGRFAFAWLGCLGILGRLRPTRRLLVRATTSVHIAGETAPFQIDGDFGGDTPIAITLADATANVFAP